MKLGIYKHSKTGKLCRVIGVAKHSETLEDMVVYEEQGENPLSKLWVRPLSMFTENVTLGGTSVPRFLFVSEKLEANR